MRADGSYGAAAGAVAIGLFAAGGLAGGDRPDFDARATEVVAFFAEHRTRIQLNAALDAAAAPFLVWFLATTMSLARASGERAARAGAVGYGCGLVFIALFLADVTALAVVALRPENMAAAPELAAALVDFEWLAMGMGAFVGAGMLAAFAVLVLRDGAVWPRPLGWLAAVAALLYALRVGTLFTTEGPFAADGALGLYVPVGALASWTVIASVVLAVGLRRAPAS